MLTMKARAKKPGYVPFRGTYVSPKGKEICEALEARMTQKECAEKFGVAIGSMSGYAKRAKEMGIETRKRDLHTIVAVSTQRGTEGKTYEMRGEKEVKALGFEYATAWKYARKKIERHGYQWFFKGEL